LTRWSKQKALEQIRRVGLIPIVRAPTAEIAMAAAEAIVTSGVGILEITMTVPNALGVLREVARRFGERALIGAGTVLDAKTCARAIRAGAEFIVAPSLELPVIRRARKGHKPCIPGALTPTEILAAWRAGADLVKVFPCGPVGGPAYIKAIRGPLPEILLVPTGGVTLETTAAFIRAGAAAVAVGGELVDVKALQEGRIEVVTENARKFLEAVNAGRSGTAS
jgi:2-dehydro-3-deoxyphosphogluconate aldolase / (4S)-4-hydroxy-2-oxoglutarate aldolase